MRRSRISRDRAAAGFLIGVAAGALLAIYFFDRRADGVGNNAFAFVGLGILALGLGVVLRRPRREPRKPQV